MPILNGSAFKNKGVQPMLDAVIDFLPSPADLPPTQGTKPGKEDVMERKPSDNEPFSALAFKIMTDPYVGKLIYLRVYSGTLDKGDTVINTTRGSRKERLGRLLLQLHLAIARAFDRFHFVVLGAQADGEQAQQTRIIVHHQNGCVF